MGATRDDQVAFLASIQRDLNGIADTDRHCRRRAFEALTKRLFTGDGSKPPPSPVLLDAIASSVVPSVTRGLHDPVEKVRESCLGVLVLYVRNCGRVSAGDDADSNPKTRLTPVLKTLLPALVMKAGTSAEEEPSEEIRLAIVGLVGELIALAGDACSPYVDELVNILCTSVNDSYHEVKKKVHGAVDLLVKAVGGKNSTGQTHKSSLELHAGKILAAVLPDATHRHSAARVSCLSAVSSVVPFCTTSEIAELLTPGIRPMCHDRTVSVRKAFHEELARWMARKNDDASSTSTGHGNETENENATDAAMVDADAVDTPTITTEAKCLVPTAKHLLPMLLTGVADEVPANSVNALLLVEAVGKANDEALRKRFGEKWMCENANDAESAIADEALLLLPHPFVDIDESSGRTTSHTPLPSNASRRLVRSLLPTLLPLAICETREWTSGRRNVGARLLATISIFARDAICASPLLPALIQCLENTVVDDDKDTAGRVLLCAKVIGAYSVDAKTSWIPLLVESITADGMKTGDSRRAASLVILASFIRGASQHTMDKQSTATLAKALAHQNVLTCDHAGVRAQTLAACVNLIKVSAKSLALLDETNVVGAVSHESKASASANLFRVLLQSRAHESPGSDGDGTGHGAISHQQNTAPGALPPKHVSPSARAMTALATACGFGSVDELYAKHARAALSSAKSECKQWRSPNPSQRAFCAFVLDAPVSVFADELSVVESVLDVFCKVSHQENDTTLRVAMLNTLDAAFEDDGQSGVGDGEKTVKINRGAALIGRTDSRAVALITKCVLPSLVWKAGATEASGRYAGVVCLGTMFRASIESTSGGDTSDTSSLTISRAAAFAVIKNETASLLPLIFSAMEEDYYPETRRAACYALRGVLATVGTQLSDENLRLVYPELTKRMDDSRDDVRVATAKCVKTFFESCVPPNGWDSTNALYFLKPFAVHMDDGNELVRDGVLNAVLAAALVKPDVVREVLTPALETHRCVGHVRTGLDACQ